MPARYVLLVLRLVPVRVLYEPSTACLRYGTVRTLTYSMLIASFL